MEKKERETERRGEVLRETAEMEPEKWFSQIEFSLNSLILINITIKRQMRVLDSLTQESDSGIKLPGNTHWNSLTVPVLHLSLQTLIIEMISLM